MGANLVGCEPADRPPQLTERTTTEIAAPQLEELISDPARPELEPELELMHGVPAPFPEATPTSWPSSSSPRLAHTLRRMPTPSIAPAVAFPEPAPRPIAMPELPPIDVPRNDPAEPMRSAPAGRQAWDRPLVIGPPKRPPAPRTLWDRLVLPVTLLLFALSSAAVLVMLR
jgi:hypothetical protein